MQNTRHDFKPTGPIRFLISLLIFALVSPLSGPPVGYARQPGQRPRQRILTQEDQKPDADKPAPSGPRVARPELVLQTGVTRPAYNALFSPDGRLLASIDRTASSIKLWEVATGRELYVINLRIKPTFALNSTVAFSPDGSSIFSFLGGTIAQWNARDGRRIRVVDLAERKDVQSACFSDDARLLVTKALATSTLAVWDTASGQKLLELNEDRDFSGRLTAFALSPDGRTLAMNVESDSGSVKSDALTLRDLAGGRLIRTIKISEEKKSRVSVKDSLAMYMSGAYATQTPARAIRFSPDGRAVTVAFHDATLVTQGGQERVTGRVNKIKTWDASSGRELISIDAGGQNSGTFDPDWHLGAVNTLAFSNDNRLCALAVGSI
ncbi:MAG TPA: WD40 repeat domain-containing protein, partial [Blastocatellia bacterium]